MKQKLTNSVHLPELYLLVREYETALLVPSDSAVKWRLRHILEDLKDCIRSVENE